MFPEISCGDEMETLSSTYASMYLEPQSVPDLELIYCGRYVTQHALSISCCHSTHCIRKSFCITKHRDDCNHECSHYTIFFTQNSTALKHCFRNPALLGRQSVWLCTRPE